MSDIFLSYAKEDREWARLLAEGLAEAGWSVFWDRTIPPGLTWRSYIGKALLDARCIVVVWSAASVESDWVLEEAEVGKKNGIVIPVLREEIEPPLGFGAIQATDLTGWGGDVSAPVFRELVRGLERLLGRSPKETKRLKAEEEKRARAEAEEEDQRRRTEAEEKRKKAEEEKGLREAQLKAEREDTSGQPWTRSVEPEGDMGSSAPIRLADLLEREGDRQAAIRVLEPLAESSEHAAVRLADLLEREGDRQAAIRVLEPWQ